MAKNGTFSFSAHAFMIKIRYTLTDIFSWENWKYNVFMGELKYNVFMSKLKVQRFHGQTELRAASRAFLGLMHDVQLNDY